MSTSGSLNQLAITTCLEQYARSGSETVLAELHAQLKPLRSAITAVVIEDVIDASVVRSCAVKLMEAIVTSRGWHPAYICFLTFCSKTYYKGASTVLADMPNYPDRLYDRLLLQISLVIARNTDGIPVIGCAFAILHKLCGELQHCKAINAHNGLRTALWRYMDGPFFQAAQEIQAAAVHACTALMCAQGNEVDHLWAPIREGACRIMVKAILHYYRCPSASASKVQIGQSMSWVLESVYRVRLVQNGGNIEPWFKIRPTDIDLLAAITYEQLETAATFEDLYNAAELSVTCAIYLANCMEIHFLGAFLLCRRSHPSDAKPLVVVIKEAILRCRCPLLENNFEEVVAQVVVPHSHFVPGVVEALSRASAPAPPTRSDKDRHCALPSCGVTGQGLVADMKKCGRCKAVYYCSEMHQKGHWREHRKVCRSKVT